MSEPIPSDPVPDDRSEQPFDYGDRTIMQMRSQPFDVAEDFGTVLNLPRTPAVTCAIAMPEGIETAAPTEDAEVPDEDPIARLERKLDLALRHIAALQQRLESMDATLVRMLTR
jgi:hypothetical protein